MRIRETQLEPPERGCVFCDLVVGAMGEVWLIDDRRRLWKFARDGTLLGKVDNLVRPPGSHLPIMENWRSGLVVADADTSTISLLENGQPVRGVSTQHPPTKTVCRADGTIFYACTEADVLLHCVAPNGDESEIPGDGRSTSGCPVMNPAGDLYHVDFRAGVVRAIEPSQRVHLVADCGYGKYPARGQDIYFVEDGSKPPMVDVERRWCVDGTWVDPLGLAILHGVETTMSPLISLVDVKSNKVSSVAIGVRDRFWAMAASTASDVCLLEWPSGGRAQRILEIDLMELSIERSRRSALDS